MKYNKQLFIDNINYLVKYNYEPEITIILKNDKKIFLIAYKEWIDLTLPSDEVIKLSRIEELFNCIDINEVVEIYDGIDHQFPIETQSIIVDNKLWIDGELPKDVFNKYKKHFSIYKCTMILYVIGLLIYLVATVLNANKFDLPVIIACAVFVISIILGMLGLTLFQIKRKKIIKKYYGIVLEEDKLIAKQLLEEIDVLDNEYDFYDKFKFDEEKVVVEQCLKLVVKGKKVYKGLSDIIFDINNEIKNNNIDNKYSDIKYNKYIENFCNLIERNNVDI
jgi:hypothetical protein